MHAAVLSSSFTGLLQVALKQWEAAEAAKKALQREVALRLKADRAQQLADRNMVGSATAECALPSAGWYQPALAATVSLLCLTVIPLRP